MTKNFADLHLAPFLTPALSDLHFTAPTKVQERVIPLILKNKSVVGQSQTGSGKTHAFLLPLFTLLDPGNQTVQAVITTPSRELAYQIDAAAKQLNRFADRPFTIHNYVGGTDKEHQLEQLAKKQPQLVIGTPGRILDLAKDGALDLHTAKRFVIDEADMTLDMGFLEQVDQIAARFPADLQMMVFSATIPKALRPFLKKYMGNPVMEEIPTETVISTNVDNWLLSTKGRDKNQLVYQLLTMGEPYLALVFANTRERATELHRYLTEQGLKVALIHGGLPPRQRKQVMRQIRTLDYQYIVATDLAARGIDLTGVSLVINDDLPTDLDYFIHRVGRTGRGQLRGVAITLYAPDEDALIQKLEDRGINFVPKVLQNGRLKTTYDRHRRHRHRRRKGALAPAVKGFVHKTKKKVKPGYKNRIKNRIKEDEQQQRKLALRHQMRKAKRARQKQHRAERQQHQNGR